MLLATDNMDSDSVAALAIFCIFGGPVMLWFAIRYMKHRERMAMIQRGLAPDAIYVPPMPGPAPAYDPGMSKREQRAARKGCDESPEGQVRKGIQTAAVGLALTIGLSFIGLDDGVMHYGPWLLGGLVPLFVGLSQIVNGVLSGAAFPFMNRGTFYGAPPPAPPYGVPPAGPSAPGTPPPPPGGPFDPYSYTYRPGTTPEIDAPPRPPDRR